MQHEFTQLAQNTTTTIEIQQPEDLPTFTISGFVSFLVFAILAIAGIVFFFMLVLGGLRWILSGGDKANTEAARNQITAALIGLIIVFSAWAIANLIDQIFGINVLNFEIPSVEQLST